MKNIIAKLMLVAFAAMSTISLNAEDTVRYNSALDIPRIESSSNWTCVPDVAQYRLADWDNVVGMAERISLEEAKEIADKDPLITFFFYTKADQMVLENEDGDAGNPFNDADNVPSIMGVSYPGIWRVFHKGDAVFFSGEPWWGSAPGLADGYIKKQ